MDGPTKQVLLQLLDSSSSSDDSEDDSVFEEFFINVLSSDDLEADEFEEEDQDDNTSNFMNTIDEYTDDDFNLHFGLKRSTVDLLIEKYFQSHTNKLALYAKKTKLAAKTEITIYLWYMRNTITLKELGTIFGVSESLVSNTVNLVSKWLVSQGSLYIKWPQDDVITQNCQKFESKTKLPGVVGVLDAIHITIPASKANKENYLNRKRTYSLVLQFVIDADFKFIDICCGEPGSLDDNSTLKRSALYKRAHTDSNKLFPGNTFLLCDSAYAITQWLVPPFSNYDQLSEQQKSFNYLHSNARTVVENTLGLLKGRFKRLTLFRERQKLSSLKSIIASACILHNFCIIHNDASCVSNDEQSVDLPLGNNEDFEGTLDRRKILFDYLCQQNII